MPVLGEIKYGSQIGRKAKYVKWVWLACKACGKEHWVDIYHLKRPKWTGLCNSCFWRALGIAQRGIKSPQWKGELSLRQGYKVIHLQPDDFFFPMCKKDGLVFEHRLVMARSLGRNLHRWEIVHHKNGIKTDNQIENLQLVTDDRHKQITILECQIADLRTRVAKLEEDNRLLSWQLKEFQRQALHW